VVKIAVERRTEGPVKTKIDQWDEKKLRDMQPQPKVSGTKRRRGEAIDEGEVYYGNYLADMQLITAVTPGADEAVGASAAI
jgi:ribosomal protein S4